ncbi:MAG: DUF2752 domain-containing protein [Bacteroidales bacterium]|nr:DUF2752 domain-containing protein [Bacteroidales bacterium]
MKNTLHIAGFIYQHLELIIWVVIIILLFLPLPAEQHFTLCPLKNMGFDYCPGCGLGRSCNMAMHGKIIESLTMHPFGIFAIIVILFRIYSLINIRIKPFKTKAL